MIYKAIIIGAGISGCTAAKTLIEQGIREVLVLEASDRVGGRVRTIKTPHGYEFEYGAQFIHGDKGNPIFTIVSDLNLYEDRGLYYHSYGNPNSIKYCNPDQTRIDPKTVAESRKIYDLVSSKIQSDWNPDESDISTFKELEFLKACDTCEVDLVLRDKHRALTDYFDKVLCVAEGIWPFDRSHLKGAHVFDDCGGKNYVFARGTYAIFEEFLLPKIQEKILLNREVEHIFWNNSEILVKTTSGEVFSTEHVIVTPSLGYLKRNHQNLFTPHLPADKREALEKLVFGKTEKIALIFDEPFWHPELEKDPDFFGYAFVHGSDDNMSELSKTITSLQGCEDTWWKAIALLNTVKTDPHTLFVRLAGEPSVAVQKYSDETVKSVIFAILKHFTGISPVGVCSLIRTGWSMDKYHLGSYTAATLSHKQEYGEAMLKPLSILDKPAILFAGEAYHPTLFSSLPGAYYTGLQQAQVILDYTAKMQDNKQT